MPPCGGGCYSINYHSAFSGKSFPVVIVSSEDFTLLGSNKLFRKMLKKEDDLMIGCFLPELIRDKCEYMEAYLKR